MPVAFADTCVKFAYFNRGTTDDFEGCEIKDTNEKFCGGNPGTGVDNNEIWKLTYIVYNFGFQTDSVTWTRANYNMIVKGAGDDGKIILQASHPFDPDTLSWSNKPSGKGEIGTSSKHGSSSKEVDLFTNLNAIKSGFSGQKAYFRLEGKEDSDDDQEGDTILTSNGNDYHYFEACYTGTPRLCNPGDPCCRSSGQAYESLGTWCNDPESVSCDTADLTTCDGSAVVDQCTGDSPECPNNNVAIDYDSACTDVDAGLCAICKGGSTPVVDDIDEACQTIDCDPLDTDCRDYNDVRYCKAVNSCATTVDDCNDYTDAILGTLCGTCGECDGQGSCSGEHPIECNVDSDCDDQDIFTRDTCVNAGTCSADCLNEIWCGNNRCDGDENSITCPTDCASCGDGICQDSENCLSCRDDCGACSGKVDLVYDGNGNLVQDMNNYYEYDELNQLVKVRQGSENGLVIVEYTYDETGARITKKEYTSNGEKITYYVGDYVKEVDSTGEKETVYYYSGSNLVGEKNSSGEMSFYHPNHLGSTHIVTNAEGELVEETEYKPFGGVVSGGSSRYTFTGQESDGETGLMYYGARYYSPVLKHFTQPDTILPNVYDPQQLNRYSYARNNPVKYSDPSGHWLHIAFGGLIGGAIGGGWNLGKQLWNGASLFDGTVDWGAVGKSAVAGGAAGAVGAATFGIVSPLFTGATGLGYVAGTTSTYAATSAMGNAAAQATNNVMAGAPVTENLFEATATGAKVGGAVGLGAGMAGLGYAAATGRVAVYGVGNVKMVNPKSLDPVHPLSRSNSLQKVQNIKNSMLKKGYDMSKPIEVATTKSGRMLISQGHHRTRAAILADLKEVPVLEASPSAYPNRFYGPGRATIEEMEFEADKLSSYLQHKWRMQK